jgi:hypothetical protein
MSKWLKNNDIFIESDTSQKCQNGWKIMMYLSNLIPLKNIKMVEKYWSDNSQKCQNDCEILTYYWMWFYY